MQSTDRLHALDAVRAFALLLGVVLHAAVAFLADFPIPQWRDEPSTGAAVIFYVIHMFRMSAFFLIAGFFGRILLERRGVKGFIRDRAKRVGLPLLAFPVVVIMIALGAVLGALPHGVDYLMALAQLPPPGAGPSAAPVAASAGSVNFAHLWFLYYLLIFYALVLALRALVLAVDRAQKLAALSDRLIAFVMGGAWGPVVLALPLTAYLWQFDAWNEWLGLPAPFTVRPDMLALVGYGLAFGFGWLLNRQAQLLLELRRTWVLYLCAALVLTAWCLWTIGTTPRWAGPNLDGTTRLAYAALYVVGMWCWIFAFIGAAVRYLSAPHPVVRYLADASYWIYLMHMTTIILFVTLLRPFDWHWSTKLLLTVGGSMPILLATYRYLVRFTWIGVMLNGRRHPRPQAPPPGAAPAQS